jgi:hypothetical protein
MLYIQREPRHRLQSPVYLRDRYERAAIGYVRIMVTTEPKRVAACSSGYTIEPQDLPRAHCHLDAVLDTTDVGAPGGAAQRLDDLRMGR